MRGPRGGQGSLERPVQPGQRYAEVACVGKGPVCSCIASEHTNPDSGRAAGSICVRTRRPRVPMQRQEPAGLCIGLQISAPPPGCGTLSESSAGSFGDALGWRHCQPQPCSVGHQVGKSWWVQPEPGMVATCLWPPLSWPALEAMLSFSPLRLAFVFPGESISQSLNGTFLVLIIQ